MKKLFGVLSLFGLFSMSGAQSLFNIRDRPDRLEWIDEDKYSYGFYLNANSFDYKVKLANGFSEQNSPVAVRNSVGFGAGLIGRMKINDYLDIRLEPGIQFVERELTFKNAAVLAVNPADRDLYTLRKVKSTYVDVPIMLELHGNRWFNSRPYAAGGINWLVNLQSNEKNVNDNLQGTFRTRTNNFAWSAEIGIQFYFSKFKLTPAIRGTFMINNELVQDNPTTPNHWAGTMSSLKTNALMFVLKFE